MYIKISKLFLSFLFLTFAGCSHDHEEEAVHEHEGISVTIWTDSTELFMEYPPLVAGQDARFLIHLSDMKDFKAVTSGRLSIRFDNTSGHSFSVVDEKPARPGIYIPTIKFNQPGTYRMMLSLIGNQVSDNIIIENLIVYSSESEAPHTDDEESSGISFLKEQQWKIDFETEPVQTREMQGSILVTGEILSKPENYSKVISPLSGIILTANNPSLRTTGSFVNKGESLLYISPSADAGSNIQKIKSDYLLSKAEYERVQNLYNKKAVSRKRLDEAKYDFESRQSSYNTLEEQIKFTEKGYTVIAPISGQLEHINFNLGDQITPGQELFTIINPARLILKANVPSSQYKDVMNSTDALFMVEGQKTGYIISQLNGRKVSVGTSIDGENRTFPIYFEFSNPANSIKVGMFSEVYIRTTQSENHLSIPQSSVVDEDGLHTAYVQLEGEAFEKRILKTGIMDNGYIQVIEGLKEGERVVTMGAYQVRLAALSPESAIGHGHAH